MNGVTRARQPSANRARPTTKRLMALVWTSGASGLVAFMSAIFSQGLGIRYLTLGPYLLWNTMGIYHFNDVNCFEKWAFASRQRHLRRTDSGARLYLPN